MSRIKVGTIINTFGIKGELKVKPATELVSQRFGADQKLQIRTDQGFVSVTAASFRMHKGFVLLKLQGYDNINDVLAYKNADLFADRDDSVRPSANRYFYYEIIGCAVYQDDVFIGTAEAIDDGPQAVLTIRRPDGGRVMMPLVPAFLKSVDAEKKRIQVTLIEGML